jgi:hypothetical protein
MSYEFYECSMYDGIKICAQQFKVGRTFGMTPRDNFTAKANILALRGLPEAFRITLNQQLPDVLNPAIDYVVIVDSNLYGPIRKRFSNFVVAFIK